MVLRVVVMIVHRYHYAQKLGADATSANAPLEKKDLATEAVSRSSDPVSEVLAESLRQLGSGGTFKEDLVHVLVVVGITGGFR